ncbi:MAG: hypothetical protein H6555_02385 [Lewinellaceae bacterium]|nr:hypothetical protein [Lewinellaceae bacterium]
MTLKDLFDYISEHPAFVVGFFALLPVLALMLGGLGRRGQESPWNYLYSGIIYGAAVPGLFAVTLNVYQFLFERQSVMNMDLFTQVLPILSMIFTLAIIRKNIDMRYIPGFDKLSGLMMMITAVLVLMWLADRTHIIAFLWMPFWVVVLIFAAAMLAMRFGFKRSFGPGYEE